MKFKCIKDYYVAKRDEIWTLDYYSNFSTTPVENKIICMYRKTKESDTALYVKKSEFMDHFIFVSI